MEKPLRIGTRGSKLALAQTSLVIGALQAAYPGLEAEVRVIKTTGDANTHIALADIGGKGLFVKDIEEALLRREVDLAVHSLKDMTNAMPASLAITAVLPREDARDALITLSGDILADLPLGAVIGTSSLRRQSQVLRLRPDLRVVPLRGNVHTRIERVHTGGIHATLLAMAGLKRLGVDLRHAHPLSLAEMLPGIGQGIVAIQCREDDATLRARLSTINHEETMRRAEAEREVLAMLDGDCRTPIGAYAEFLPSGALRLRGLVASPDGKMNVEEEAESQPEDAVILGKTVGERLLARAGGIFLQCRNA